MDPVLRFPDGFLWGTATSSHQVEGDNLNNQWWAWEEVPGRIWHNDRSGIACDWWRRAEDDLDLARNMNNNSHRLSLEWSRIEPSEGHWDQKAIDRYREILKALQDRGMEPMVTLHHFTDPLWLAAKGGWESEGVMEHFSRYAAKILRELGDLARLWCTINEPTVYSSLGYVLGIFPPGKKNITIALRVLRNMLLAHGRAYGTIKRLKPDAQVGIANHIRLFDPASPKSPLDRFAARLQDCLFNDVALLAPIDGRLRFPLGLGGVIDELKDSADFIGVNYYTRDMVAFDLQKAGELFGRRFYRPGAEMSDPGLHGSYGEVYPEGLYRILKRVSVFGKPIYITENGLPDGDDDQRPCFLLRHLAEVHRAIGEGMPVKGYYYWSLIDNFEWAEGWGLRFGLVALDERTGKRSVRPSGELYAQICLTNSITPEMAKSYAPF